ncbi:hypothetical protein KAFR_0D04190 [Kazachstania africana CBS 2517]|uniref:Pre-mRNA-splicing factor SPF27 n=1 Tax=Kazachstania africana (strain ATCC 22294 / BCRC 22015 / CBS 2517 / CECT 1963 / NBRC 1671 / NRRL Y-8276) TaxID=1071382 RepID=H2AUL7_KAZAF|nr:hypothetical protein KAFR_0D04190 [Kazachstania africana CBS 2517]CCF58067.1 hypothetical protein KAFR_0D04190 [Kazachstania africana CBS 2517]
MDYLPFIDSTLPHEDAQNAINMRVKRALQEINEEIHPEVQKLLDNVGRRNIDDKLYESYLESEDEDAFLKAYRKECGGVDLMRYSMDNEQDVERLAISDSYLRHQCITLEKLMSRTIMNQWTMNNVFLQNLNEQVGSMVTKQKRKNEDLINYRIKLQKTQEKSIRKLEMEYNDALIDRIT